MNNLFDSDNYPDEEPTELVAGNRWAWTRSDITAAYPTAAYTLKYRFSLLDGTHFTEEFTAGKTGDVHIVEQATTATSGYPAGDYRWQAVIVRVSDSEEITVDTGLLVITPDLDGDAVNAASWVYEVLTAIRATIKGTASEKQAAYSIGGRSLSLRSLTELLDLEREFSKRWDREKAEIERKAGRATGNRVLVTMGA